MSKFNYDALGMEGLKEILGQVSNACKELDIDFFIVGAVARNIWFATHGESFTGTKDIDFGIYVPTRRKYDQLKNQLIEKFSYKASSENAFCLIAKDGKQIDLLPFGEIEREEQKIIDGTGLTNIRLDGFRESYELGLTNVQIGKETYRVCTIPAMVILKLIAYDDRPDRRIKDVKDINAICQHYPEIESESIWANHFDLYEDDKEHHEVAMIALGREMNIIIEKNPNLKDRIIRILDTALDEKSPFLSHMIESAETETLEMKATIVKHVKQGLMG